MADLKCEPVPHDHAEFLARARLEAAGRHAPSLATLEKYAAAVACALELKLVPQK